MERKATPGYLGLSTIICTYYHYYVIIITTMYVFNVLVLSLPARNSTVRMRVWRALKDGG